MVQKKEQKELIALAALLLVAAATWHFYFRSANPGSSVLSASGNYTPINAQDFGLIFGPLQKSQATEYKTSGRNIFVAGPAPVVSDPNVPKKTEPPSYAPGGIYPQRPPPPPPPVLPMKFFGYGTLPSGGQRKAFLLDGDEVRIVVEGDTILSHIRITHIGTDKIEFEDTLTGQRGSNNLEVAPAT